LLRYKGLYSAERSQEGVRKKYLVVLPKQGALILVVEGWVGLGPGKVPELLPMRDIFERQLRDSPSRFAAIYMFGILVGPKAWFLSLEATYKWACLIQPTFPVYWI
jgi:hypothetical protein